LRCRGLESRCYANGVDEPVGRDGIRWAPLEVGAVRALVDHVLVVDSYRLAYNELDAAARANRLVVMHDFGDPPDGAALVVSVAAQPANATGWLKGFSYAALRPAFWGLPDPLPSEHVRRVLVTTGGGEFADLGVGIARALTTELRDVQIAVIAGPQARVDPPRDIQLGESPATLLEALRTADLAVTAAGQTMLEAAAVGTPCVALPLVENQRPQGELLARLGAVRLADPPDEATVLKEVVDLARDAAARKELSVRSRDEVDGFGALRVAFHVSRLADAVV
jgi:UDP-2,4-diacetamido-2,4,6-trideoxy-beta-L-altropyranose hydrolase